MKRILRTLLTLLSLLLCAVALTCWLRSYTGSDYIQRTQATAATSMSISSESWSLQWTRGQLRLIRDTNTNDYPHPDPMTPEERRPSWTFARLGYGHFGWNAPTTGGFLGFQSWDSGLITSFSDTRSHTWAMPAWLFPLAFAIAPARAIRSALIRRRYRPGCCQWCHYDLTANLSGVCPECGTAITNATR